jgi:hypothetical protein
MAITEADPTLIHQQRPDDLDLALSNYGSRLEAAAATDDIDLALDRLFPPDEIAQHTQELLDKAGFDDKANGRRWAVMVLDGNDPLVDVAERVETEGFSKFFGTHPVKHYAEYGAEYNKSSIFVTVIDAHAEGGPRAASALRIVKDSPRGFKTMNSLSSPDLIRNPWADEIKAMIGDFGYEDKDRVQQELADIMGIDLSTTWAIESMAALPEYQGNNGGFGEATFPLYAACLELSNRTKEASNGEQPIHSWISIQDLPPLQQMQDLFAEPWKRLPEVTPRPYDGDGDTVPAVIQSMDIAQANLEKFNPKMADLMIRGAGLEAQYVTAIELQGDDYLNALVD